MRNYEMTRGKIKNYLSTLKEKYSTNEWKDFEPNALCKEFGVSVTLPQLLKKGGYLFYENKKMMLSQKIFNIDEIQAHTKILDYCNDSKHRIAIRKAKKKEQDKIKADKLKKKKVAEEQKKQTLLFKQIKNQKSTKIKDESVLAGYSDSWVRIYVPTETYNILERVSKNMHIGIPDLVEFTFKELQHFTQNDELIKLVTTKFINEPLIEKSFERAYNDLYIKNDAPPAQPTFAEIQDKLRNDPEFSNSFNQNHSVPKKPKGRPIKQKSFSQDPAYLEALRNAPAPPPSTGNDEFLKMINRYHQPTKEIDDAEIKIKSLETIMNLFLKGIINTEELESLKKGILNK